MSSNEAIQKVSQAIELAIGECGVEAISSLPTFMQAVRMAHGISALRAALTDQFVQSTLMPLMGTKLGFLTDLDHDKDGRRYGLAVVRDCCIEAMLRGFSVVGNEFNVIAGGFYGAKAGWARKLAQYPGLTDLVLQAGVPQSVGDKGALVPYVASWRLNGKEMVLRCAQEKDGTDLRIPIKVHAGMGADAVLGKAERKMLFRVYQRVNGSTFGAVDGEIGEEPITTTGEPVPTPVPEGTPDGRRIKMNGKRPAPAPAPETPPATPAPQATAQPKAQEASPEDDGRIT